MISKWKKILLGIKLVRNNRKRGHNLIDDLYVNGETYSGKENVLQGFTEHFIYLPTSLYWWIWYFFPIRILLPPVSLYFWQADLSVGFIVLGGNNIRIGKKYQIHQYRDVGRYIQHHHWTYHQCWRTNDNHIAENSEYHIDIHSHYVGYVLLVVESVL
jgi:hypothetical protein